MAYSSLRHSIEDLPADQILHIDAAVDPNLEIGEIHRRVYHAGGPALHFKNVKGSPFPALSNLYGTKERTAYLFRHQLEQVQRLIQLKADPADVLRHPGKFLKTPFTALHGLPMKAIWNKPVLFGTTSLDKLPQIISWPKDGGAFITLSLIHI